MHYFHSLWNNLDVPCCRRRRAAPPAAVLAPPPHRTSLSCWQPTGHRLNPVQLHWKCSYRCLHRPVWLSPHVLPGLAGGIPPREAPLPPHSRNPFYHPFRKAEWWVDGGTLKFQIPLGKVVSPPHFKSFCFFNPPPPQQRCIP